MRGTGTELTGQGKSCSLRSLTMPDFCIGGPPRTRKGSLLRTPEQTCGL